MSEPSRFTSKHFTLEPVAPGVLAAIAVDGGAAICNSGLVDLGGQILVFDTFLTPQAALDLRQAALDIFGRSPSIVINSHYHNDHIWGNQVFIREAQIIASARTRQLITTEGSLELEWYKEKSTERLASLELEYQNTRDEAQRSEQNMYLGYYRGLVEAMPTLSLCMPGVTFSHRLDIFGSTRHAELLEFDGGHTGSDSVLYLPDDGIIFVSDLLFVGFHPYLADGDPLLLLKALQEVSGLDATRLVPGHGPVGDRQDLKLLVDYIEYCLDTASKLVQGYGGYQERIPEIAIPKQYSNWQLPQFFRENLSFLCERLG